MSNVAYCELCGRNVKPEREFNWLVFIFLLGLFYLPFYFMKPESCPICKSTALTPVRAGAGPSPFAPQGGAQPPPRQMVRPAPQPVALAAPTALAAGVQLASDPRYQAGFQGNVLNIGRDPSNQMVLTDSLASRHHARIASSHSGYVIEDMNSANGTYVNGRAITRASLRQGDRIRIGNTSLIFRG